MTSRRLLSLIRRDPPRRPSAFGAGDGHCGATIEPGVAGRTAFTLRVQTGCAEPCSYCIIPETRGAPRSVSIAHVLGEVRRVVAAGFKEVALTGVHLGSYGRDLDTPATLVQLLTALRDDFGRRTPAATLRSCSASARSSRWTARRRSSRSWRCRRASLRTSTCRCSTRARGCSRPMRRPYDVRYYARARGLDPSRHPARLDRVRHHRRISGRDRR